MSVWFNGKSTNCSNPPSKKRKKLYQCYISNFVLFFLRNCFKWSRQVVCSSREPRKASLHLRWPRICTNHHHHRKSLDSMEITNHIHLMLIFQEIVNWIVLCTLYALIASFTFAAAFNCTLSSAYEGFAAYSGWFILCCTQRN